MQISNLPFWLSRSLIKRSCSKDGRGLEREENSKKKKKISTKVYSILPVFEKKLNLLRSMIYFYECKKISHNL